MSERDYLAKEEALRRLSEPEGDHELHTALERMRVHHPHLWEVLHRVHLAHDAAPQSLMSGEGHQRVARRTSGPSIMTRRWGSYRCRFSSFRKAG
jgi:hypothetical protein